MLFRTLLCAFLLSGAVLAAGCGSDADSSPPGEEATPGAAGPSIDAPPGTTGSAGGRSVELGIGSFCWTTMCVDKIGPITRGTLQVSRGDRVAVAIPPGTPPLRQVNVSAFPAGASQDVGNGDTAWRPDFDRGSQLTATRFAQAVEFNADLAPGRYVVTLGMFFTPGDVMYGLVLEVR